MINIYKQYARLDYNKDYFCDFQIECTGTKSEDSVLKCIIVYGRILNIDQARKLAFNTILSKLQSEPYTQRERLLNRNFDLDCCNAAAIACEKDEFMGLNILFKNKELIFLKDNVYHISNDWNDIDIDTTNIWAIFPELKFLEQFCEGVKQDWFIERLNELKLKELFSYVENRIY